MKTREDFTMAVQTSTEYRRMFRDIVLFQINNLMEQLSYAGVESVLLTAILSPDGVGGGEDSTTGSRLGRQFLHEMAGYQTTFKEYCLRKAQSGDHASHPQTSTPTMKPAVTTENGRERDEVDTSVNKRTPIVNTDRPPEKRAKYDTSFKTVSPEITPSKTTGDEVDVATPDGHHKCSACSYSSKFKANVSRHERSRHGLNLEGIVMPSIQYGCLLCPYKSLYRSNLMRHEKTIHKIDSTKMDMETRKIPYDNTSDINTTYSMETEVYQPVDQMEQPSNSETNERIGQPSFSRQSQRLDTNRQSDGFKNNGRGQVLMNVTHTVDGIKQEVMDTTYTVGAVKQEVEDDWTKVDHVCNHCQLVFRTECELNSHVETSQGCRDGNGPLTCDFCGENFSDVSNKQLHELTCNIKQLEKCDECGKRFQYRTSLLRHQARCKGTCGGTSLLQYPVPEQNVSGTSQQEVIAGTSQQEVIAGTSQQEVIPGTSQKEVIPGTSQKKEVSGISQHEEISETSRKEVTSGTSQKEVILEKESSRRDHEVNDEVIHQNGVLDGHQTDSVNTDQNTTVVEGRGYMLGDINSNMID